MTYGNLMGTRCEKEQEYGAYTDQVMGIGQVGKVAIKFTPA